MCYQGWFFPPTSYLKGPVQRQCFAGAQCFLNKNLPAFLDAIGVIVNVFTVYLGTSSTRIREASLVALQQPQSNFVA